MRKYIINLDVTDSQLVALYDLMTEIAFMLLEDKGINNGGNECGRMQKIPARTEPFA